MQRRPILLWMLLWTLTLGGCALPQQVEHYFFEKDGAVVATAWRYAGKPDNPVDDLWIDLTKAPAFEIRLPDGRKAWVQRGDVTFETKPLSVDAAIADHRKAL